MPRVKRGVEASRRHKKILKQDATGRARGVAGLGGGASRPRLALC